jgi:ketosteroid isomerase-like protein
MITILFAIAAVSGAAATEAKCVAIGPHPAPVLSYICKSEREWAESVASGDTSAVKRILSEDFIGVDPKGKQYRKAEMVADTAEAPKYFNSNVIGDIIVRFYGNTAVAQGSETWRKKKGDTGRFVWTDTWVKRNGTWQIVAAEDLIAPAEPAK